MLLNGRRSSIDPSIALSWEVVSKKKTESIVYYSDPKTGESGKNFSKIRR